AEAIRGGAAIKALWLPGPDPEPQYRPSARLAAFVRARDLFCRFPGCTVPAERCDIDHVVPWPYGPTHASNLNCKCRSHHLAKTFGDGWRDEQLPDGTVIWTTPAGKRYTTVPGSRLFFPAWDTSTAELPPMSQPPPDPGRTAKMPRRGRTRAAENTARIKAERDYNAAQRALEQHRAPAAERPPPDYGDDPPPF
ncbi:HNH endonuclease signature motif containing protein, partial [Mycobacterium sp. NAZ190054]|uniref:HNH endonuclease signature motif containing protein n=1 Tax=Mycobacterium sp. NAZ190054 TaxID=1747766 RepID=UPI000AD739B0